ncbi:MAG: hypothetical protein IT172_05415 [Acidobacteria bacterium]|nr:hypothetical protein [Acidobacteriota bacterium]
MSKRTIADFSRFVILAAAVAVFQFGCGMRRTDAPKADSEAQYLPPKTVGKISDDAIPESSGIAASKCQPDVFWTHNDSGYEPYLFAISLTGTKLGMWKVPNARNLNWEDIAIYKDNSGKCYLYIGEIGDNGLVRDIHTIYRVAEPKIPRSGPARSNIVGSTTDAATLNFIYADGRHDAETLLVDPQTADIYILTKQLTGPSGVYKLQSDFGKAGTAKAEKVAEVSFPAIPNGAVTGGDISPDGRRVAICDYGAAYELRLPDSAHSFDEIWSQPIETIDAGKRKAGEAITYTPDGNALVLTSEGRGEPIIEIERKDRK